MVSFTSKKIYIYIYIRICIYMYIFVYFKSTYIYIYIYICMFDRFCLYICVISLYLSIFIFKYYIDIQHILLRSMGSTLRTKARPLGRSDSVPVDQGNTLCARTLVLMLLCSCKGIFWALEQPGTSTMEWHPCFQYMLRLLTVRRLKFRMSRFGGPTPKPTILYSSNLHDDIVSERPLLTFVWVWVYLQVQNQNSLYFGIVSQCLQIEVIAASLTS